MTKPIDTKPKADLNSQISRLAIHVCPHCGRRFAEPLFPRCPICRQKVAK